MSGQGGGYWIPDLGLGWPESGSGAGTYIGPAFPNVDNDISDDPKNPDGSCKHDYLCAYCNSALDGDMIRKMADRPAITPEQSRVLHTALSHLTAYHDAGIEELMRVLNSHALEHGA